MIERLFGDIVGGANVLTDPKDTQPYLTDWRRQYTGTAECVVRPANTAEVARVVDVCARERIAIVPQGGNTSLCGGATGTGVPRTVQPKSKMQRRATENPSMEGMAASHRQGAAAGVSA